MTRPSRRTRTRVIWILLLLTLSPGLVAAAFREQWAQLPPGVHLSVYLLSAVFLIAAVSLIIRSRDPVDQRRDFGPAVTEDDV